MKDALAYLGAYVLIVLFLFTLLKIMEKMQ